MRLDILACVPSRTDWFRRNRREDKTEVYASATTIGCANPGFRFGRRRDLKAALRRKLTAAQTDRTTATQQRKGSTSRLRLRRLVVRANDSLTSVSDPAYGTAPVVKARECRVCNI